MRFAIARPSGIYVTGRTENSIVALGGSGKHLIGSVRNLEDRDDINSLLFHLAGTIVSLSEGGAYVGSDEHELLERMEGIEMAAFGIPEKLEFVAKRLLLGKSDRRSKQVLLATPLYIAKAD